VRRSRGDDRGRRFTVLRRPDRTVSFVYEMQPGGDLRKCREALAGAKADPILWSAFVAAIVELERTR
jgi:hypothetical protein